MTYPETKISLLGVVCLHMPDAMSARQGALNEGLNRKIPHGKNHFPKKSYDREGID